MATERPHSDNRTTTLWRFSWKWLPGRNAIEDGDLLQACADLYSQHYGTWGDEGPRPGERIQMPVERLRAGLDDPDGWLACAYHFDRLIGYCSAVQTTLRDHGRVVWATQLVVDSSFREEGVGTTLLYGVWQFSDCFAWGLATANPLAVRALETATRRPCREAAIRELAPAILPMLAEKIDYLPRELVIEDGQPVPKVDTNFHVNHGEMDDLREKAQRADRPWALGAIAEGQEWFACTFRAQPPAAMDSGRLARLLEGADEIWVHAYEGMTLDEGHRWRQHAEHEVAEILAVTEMPRGARVLDVGCGDGRHIEALARRDFDVVGLDISERLIAEARARVGGAASLEVADARELLPEGEFDLILCLYDVLGSSASIDDDRAILRNVLQRLRPGGWLVASVMNTAATLGRLRQERRPETVEAFVAALEELPPSRIMESSGAIFDPEHLLYFDGLHFRKEQFDLVEGRLPSELVVRDKRYAEDELRDLLAEAGYRDISVRPVQLGRWNRPLDAHDERAKELLAYACKLHDVSATPLAAK